MSREGVRVWNQSEGKNLGLDVRATSSLIHFSRTPDC